MADNRTHGAIARSTHRGYKDAILFLKSANKLWNIKHGLLNLVQNNNFFGNDKEGPTMLTSKGQPGLARKRIRPLDVYEAWDRFNDLLRGCPHHGFSELHQLDTFYNALNSNDQDSLNSAAGGNFLDKMPRECLKIIESKSKAAAANFNQANSGYRPPMVSNQIRPPGFPPVQNPHANSQNNFNRGNNFNQNRGNNFNQGQIYRPPVHQPVVNQPVAHQGPAPQTHGVSKTDFERYVTANDAVLRNMQNQGQNLQSQMANLTDMLSKFVTANTASTSGSGTLPGNTITNPKEDLKGITTRSGVTIQGPKAVNHDTEVTKDKMPPANNGSTEDVQPPVVQIQSRNPNPEPNVAPVVTPASIPFPSRRNDEKRKEKANDQIEKFYEIFRDLNVYEGEITLRVGKEAITFNLDQTSRYTADYNHMTVNKIDVIDMACDEYSQEVLGFSNVIASGNPTPYFEPIVSTA
ncbi:hypothetical protein Tco_1338868 [Tanacetum coccineum]